MFEMMEMKKRNFEVLKELCVCLRKPCFVEFF